MGRSLRKRRIGILFALRQSTREKPGMSSTLFYAQLPLLTDFDGAGRQESYTPLPNDWHVVMCDVRNSTAAVEAGMSQTAPR